MFYLLGWREVYPWISLQIFPLLAYWWYRNNPPIDWFVPIFVLHHCSRSVSDPCRRGPRMGSPTRRSSSTADGSSCRASPALFFYTELKNVMARTAHLKEAMRERKWKVTPRTGSVALDAEADHRSDEPAEPALLAWPDAAAGPTIGHTADPSKQPTTVPPADTSAATTSTPDQPAVPNRQPAERNPQPAERNRQPAERNRQPAERNRQPAAEPEPRTEPATSRTEPATSRTEPATSRTEPATSRTEPATSRPTPAVRGYGRAGPPAPQPVCPRPSNADWPGADG